MSRSTIDPQQIKEQQRRTWDGVSAGWQTSMPVFERSAAAVTDRLLRLGGVRPGHRVLDIGTGLGEPAASAARLVGPTGRVVGIDLSPAMIDAARRRGAGVSQLTYAVADFETGGGLPARSFDVALSRWGLMFAVHRTAAFRAVARLLVPGGVIAAAVWGPPPDAPVMAFSYAVLSRRLSLSPPPPGTPGPFSLADPAELATGLAAAGFREVTVEPVVIPFRFSSTAEYVDFSRAVTPPGLLDVIRERTGDPAHPATWQAVGEAARERFADGAGLLLPSTALVLRATVGGA